MQLREAAPTGRTDARVALVYDGGGAVPKHNSLKINFNHEETNQGWESGARATLAGWNRFNMQKNNLILPKVQDEAAEQKPPPASSSQSSLAAAHRQLSGRTRTEGAGGKKEGFKSPPNMLSHSSEEKSFQLPLIFHLLLSIIPISSICKN